MVAGNGFAWEMLMIVAPVGVFANLPETNRMGDRNGSWSTDGAPASLAAHPARPPIAGSPRRQKAACNNYIAALCRSMSGDQSRLPLSQQQPKRKPALLASSQMMALLVPVTDAPVANPCTQTVLNLDYP